MLNNKEERHENKSGKLQLLSMKKTGILFYNIERMKNEAWTHRFFMLTGKYVK